MSQPIHRGKGAIGTIISTVISVLTLPFRVLGQLFGRSRRRRRL